MNVVIAKERRFQMDPDGVIYTDNKAASGYAFWQRYLEVFDSVTILARVRPGVDSADGRVTGPGVYFIGLPYYLGPRQYLAKVVSIRRKIAALSRLKMGDAAFIGRAPGTIASNLIRVLDRQRYPYGLEVVGDPYDVFAPGSIQHPLSPLFRQYFTRKLQQQCARACTVSYVTGNSLQKRYPPQAGAFNTSYSSIQLLDSDFSAGPKTFNHRLDPMRLIFVGTLSQMYKAPDVLIESVAICRAQGLDIRLRIIGEGQFRRRLEAQSERLGIADKVVFLGRLPAGAAIRHELDQADLFVLPSRGEGLPRAMIEAMARGLPCVGTTASGIPELLHADDLVTPNDPVALAKILLKVGADPARMQAMARRNYEKAREYREHILQKRRVAFYSELRDITLRHVNGRVGYG